jgi:ESCRT-II complex subunit VPS22
MRRGVGLGAIQQRQKEKAAAEAVGSQLAENRAKHVEEQLSAFKTHLETFARKHRKEINKDPEFRRAFAKMTKSIGVDPLASSKGFWGEVLGVGDFYWELSIQIVDVCLNTRSTNGGLISISELTSRLTRMRGGSSTATSAGAGAGSGSRKHEAISADDVRKAVDKLAVLGGGYRLVTLDKGETYLLSVPLEMNNDTTAVLTRLSSPAFTVPSAATSHPKSGSFACVSTTVSHLQAQMASSAGWDSSNNRSRVEACLRSLVKDGMAWVDDEESAAIDKTGIGGSGPRYYFPAVQVTPAATVTAPR